MDAMRLRGIGASRTTSMATISYSIGCKPLRQGATSLSSIRLILDTDDKTSSKERNCC